MQGILLLPPQGMLGQLKVGFAATRDNLRGHAPRWRDTRYRARRIIRERLFLSLFLSSLPRSPPFFRVPLPLDPARQVYTHATCHSTPFKWIFK